MTKLIIFYRKGVRRLANKKQTESKEPVKKLRPATTPEARENQLIALAVDLAEKQLLDGTASSQVITHYLKLGTQKEKLEREILEKKKDLMQAQTDNLQSVKKIEEMYTEAIKAMRHYSGQDAPKDDDDEYED